MIIPIKTDRPPRRRPIVTEAIIVANMLTYLVMVAGTTFGWFEREALANAGHFVGADFKAWQLITYQFLHDPWSIWHLAFNMLFLWVFGCPVEDRLGRFGFLGFYLIAGAVAGLAHSGLEPQAPVIGASGSIAGVTGAFLALFPRSRIKVFVFFFIIGVYSIPSLWLVGFFFVVDLLSQTRSLLGSTDSGVAYVAHIAGYIYGFATGFALLATGILKREEYDVFYMFKQARRRAAFRAAGRGSPGAMWDTAPRGESKPSSRRARTAPHEPMSPRQERLAAARSAIHARMDDHDLDGAARAYADLLDDAPEVVLTEARQIDVANQLYALGDHAHAATAYERMLESYAGSSHTTEVKLILGLLYARQLARPDRARELIAQARPRLTDEQQRTLADALLAELGQ